MQPRSLMALTIAAIACTASLLLSSSFVSADPVPNDRFADLPYVHGDRWAFMGARVFATTNIDKGLSGIALGDKEGRRLLLYGRQPIILCLDYKGDLLWSRSDLGHVQWIEPKDEEMIAVASTIWATQGGPHTRISSLSLEGQVMRSFVVPSDIDVIPGPAGTFYGFSRDGRLSSYSSTGEEHLLAHTEFVSARDGRQHVAQAPHGLLIVADQSQGRIRAYWPNGRMAWETKTGGKPAILHASDEHIYIDYASWNGYVESQLQSFRDASVSRPANRLQALDYDGSILWERTFENANYLIAAPHDKGGVMLLPKSYADYVGAWLENDALALDLEGNTIWNTELPKEHYYAARPVDDGRIYVCSGVRRQQELLDWNNPTCTLHRLNPDGSWETLYEFPQGCWAIDMISTDRELFVLLGTGETPRRVAIFTFTLDGSYILE